MTPKIWLVGLTYINTDFIIILHLQIWQSQEVMWQNQLNRKSSQLPLFYYQYQTINCPPPPHFYFFKQTKTKTKNICQSSHTNFVVNCQSTNWNNQWVHCSICCHLTGLPFSFSFFGYDSALSKGLYNVLNWHEKWLDRIYIIICIMPACALIWRLWDLILAHLIWDHVLAQHLYKTAEVILCQDTH